MTHWFIRREERLYLYGKQGLHQLKANPQTARKLKEAVFGDRSANWMPVDEALAARLLPGEQRSASSGGNSDGTLTPRGEWQLRVITPDKALLLRYLTPGDELEITAAVEEGNPQWKSAMAQPLLLSYAESIAAACDGLQDEEAQAAKRVIQIDLGGPKLWLSPSGCSPMFCGQQSEKRGVILRSRRRLWTGLHAWMPWSVWRISLCTALCIMEMIFCRFPIK